MYEFLDKLPSNLQGFVNTTFHQDDNDVRLNIVVSFDTGNSVAFEMVDVGRESYAEMSDFIMRVSDRLANKNYFSVDDLRKAILSLEPKWDEECLIQL